MPPPVTRQEDQRNAANLPPYQHVGGIAPRGLDPLLADIFQPVDLIETGATAQCFYLTVSLLIKYG